MAGKTRIVTFQPDILKNEYKCIPVREKGKRSMSYIERRIFAKVWRLQAKKS